MKVIFYPIIIEDLVPNPKNCAKSKKVSLRSRKIEILGDLMSVSFQQNLPGNGGKH